MGCLCNNVPRCAERLEQVCPFLLIGYPREAAVTPYTFFFYNRTRDWQNKRPDLILINGTVRCRGSLVTLTKFIPFDINLNARRIIEELLCRLSSTNISLSENILTDQQCLHANESSDRCSEWNQCLSNTRIVDGMENCLNATDEKEPREMEIEKSCARVRHHRFRCSIKQLTCLSVMTLGDHLDQCENEFDELWFGVGRTISSVNCHDRRKDECSRVRHYIDQSWKSLKNEINSERGLSLHSYCDTFGKVGRKEDEDLPECRRSWICLDEQWSCQSGQCIERIWVDDAEWDCADASDEHNWLKYRAQWTLRHALNYNFTNRSYFVPHQCHQSAPFLCLSSEATRQGFSCFNLSQIGDGHIDCAGATDERLTLKHCSRPSVLGASFLCPSSNTCIPYWFHCSTDTYRCPNRSDDEHWCARQNWPANCIGMRDFICFDGRCFKQARCNRRFDCPFGEDEYMCDYVSSNENTLVPHRREKRFNLGAKPNTLRFPLYPSVVNTTELDSHSLTTVAPPRIDIRNISSSTILSPFRCNRGLSILAKKNHSIVCFCPSQYSGAKCEYHTDRLSVLLHLDLSQSIDFSLILLKLLVLFLVDDEVVQRDQFHLHPSSQQINSLIRKKFISHFVYPRSPVGLQQRQERFFNRSDLLLRRPYSVRIELYQTPIREDLSLIGVWSYSLPFDQLPVTRLAKVLHLASFTGQWRNPCSSRPCHPNERCHSLMNNRSRFICLCPTNFTGPNCSIQNGQCSEGYCLSGSLCQPDARSPFPFCLCPANQFGQRCSIEHTACLSDACLNNGSCFPDSQPDRVICLCPKEYAGSRCQFQRPSIHLSLSTHLSYAGAVIQLFDIDFSSPDLIPIHQQVFENLPENIEYYHHQEKTSITGIVLVKLYSFHDVVFPDLYLLSAYQNIFSLHGTTTISHINRCEHRRTFSDGIPLPLVPHNSIDPLLTF